MVGFAGRSPLHPPPLQKADVGRSRKISSFFFGPLGAGLTVKGGSCASVLVHQYTSTLAQEPGVEILPPAKYYPVPLTGRPRNTLAPEGQVVSPAPLP